MYRVKSKAFYFTVVTEDIKKLTIRQITRDNVEKLDSHLLHTTTKTRLIIPGREQN